MEERRSTSNHTKKTRKKTIEDAHIRIRLLRRNPGKENYKPPESMNLNTRRPSYLIGNVVHLWLRDVYI